MKFTTVMTDNVVRAKQAIDRLLDPGRVEEGMGLIYGVPGEGKSTTVAYLTNLHRGIFLRATVAWTVTSMLQSLMRELDLATHGRRAPMIEQAIESLVVDPRPIFIDEADYLLRQMDMLDALRDIYDTAQVPVVLITMEDAPRKIKSTPRLARFRRRISQWVQFEGITLDDAQEVCDEMGEVQVAGDLVERLHAESQGNIGRIVIGLGYVERFAKGNNLEAVDLAAYGKRPLGPTGP